MSGEARAIPVRMQVYQTAIPTKGFEHAAASRDLAEAVVVRVEFAGGAVGWGETLPRPYVTGETLETVVEDLAGVFWPAVAGREVRPEDIGRIAAAASTGKRLLNAAACAIEMAIALPSNRSNGNNGGNRSNGNHRDSPLRALRVSGVLGHSDPARTARQLRRMRWFGLRDFKLKLGFSSAVDAENLRAAWKQLHRGLRGGAAGGRERGGDGGPRPAVQAAADGG